jgi:hypothetical protein
VNGQWPFRMLLGFLPVGDLWIACNTMIIACSISKNLYLCVHLKYISATTVRIVVAKNPTEINEPDIKWAWLREKIKLQKYLHYKSFTLYLHQILNIFWHRVKKKTFKPWVNCNQFIIVYFTINSSLSILLTHNADVFLIFHII